MISKEEFVTRIKVHAEKRRRHNLIEEPFKKIQLEREPSPQRYKDMHGFRGGWG